MDCPKTESGEVVLACPPDDSLEEIFSCLSAKPLFRFKCVSKDWCALIEDRLGYRKFPQILEGFFSGDAAESYGRFIGPPRPVPLVDHSFSFLTKSPEIEKIELLGSCNGLVLFAHRRVSDSYDSLSLGYIVCNPATEEWVSVPSSGYTPLEWDGSDSDDEDKLVEASDTYLIFDPALSPHFQLIQLWLGYDQVDFHEVHTFSSVTGAWRKELEGVLDLTRSMPTVGPSACPLNGMLHVPLYQHHLPEGNRNMILAIGGEGRPLRTLHWPKKERGFILFVGQSQGHLHCLSGHMRKDSLTMTKISIWVLEDYNAEKWVLRDNVSISQMFGRMSGRSHADWNVVGIHPDRNLVFFVEYWNCELISYDMDKKEVLALCSLHGYRRFIIPYVPYFAVSGAQEEALRLLLIGYSMACLT